jgi:hypothetical protein
MPRTVDEIQEIVCCWCWCACRPFPASWLDFLPRSGAYLQWPTSPPPTRHTCDSLGSTFLCLRCLYCLRQLTHNLCCSGQTSSSRLLLQTDGMLTGYFRDKMAKTEDITARNEAHSVVAQDQATANTESWTLPTHFGAAKSGSVGQTRPASKNVGYSGY